MEGSEGQALMHDLTTVAFYGVNAPSRITGVDLHGRIPGAMMKDFLRTSAGRNCHSGDSRIHVRRIRCRR